jgi:light-regulated signal transduction histidine kinase (bacteriophytochrome)
VLAEDYADKFDEEAKSIFKEIIANSRVMGELIDNLLEFSRVGKQHISMSEVSIQALVNSVIEEQKQQAPYRTFNILLKDLKSIHGDRNMLKQVFLNLISNAIKYSGKKEEPMIEIGSYQKDDQHIYYVKDNGAGFDMEYYQKLFGVFQRLHSNNEFEGTGVGLAIVQRIIMKHGGSVWAEGKVNEGACFYISLPDTLNNKI